MSLPSVWYLMHLRADNGPAGPDGYEVWGASIPGVPCVQIGHNRFIAWGITAALCDDVEIYREKMHRLHPDLYLVGHRWQKLESRKELIAVRGAKLLEKIVRASRHGPAISDFRATSDGKEILTARWTAHEPSRELNSLYCLNCARDWKQFQDSLRLHAAPSLNFVYADHADIWVKTDEFKNLTAKTRKAAEALSKAAAAKDEAEVNTKVKELGNTKEGACGDCHKVFRSDFRKDS